jgi:hypothetical protein
LKPCPTHSAPYLCVEDKNARGCSPWPTDTLNATSTAT